MKQELEVVAFSDELVTSFSQACIKEETEP